MKKITVLVMVLMLIIGLAACGNNLPSNDEGNVDDIQIPSNLEHETYFEPSNEVIDESSAFVAEEDSIEQDTDASSEEVEPKLMGELSFDDISMYTNASVFGLWVKYPDNSFSSYAAGCPMFEDEQYMMSYGADPFPDDVLIWNQALLDNNDLLADNGELVMFWPSELDYVSVDGLYKIDEAGYCLNSGIYATRDGQLKYNWDYWPIDYHSVNNIEEQEFMKSDMFIRAQDNGDTMASFERDGNYTITFIDGTALKDREYTANRMYFLYKDANGGVPYEKTGWTEYSKSPTKEGYATLDFTSVEPGTYAFIMSYWDQPDDERESKSYILQIGDNGQVVPYELP